MKFLLGFAIGLGISVLFAPAPGKETRRALKQRLRDFERLPHRKVEQAAEMAREKAGEIGADIGRRAAESAVETIENNVLGKNRTA